MILVAAGLLTAALGALGLIYARSRPDAPRPRRSPTSWPPPTGVSPTESGTAR